MTKCLQCSATAALVVLLLLATTMPPDARVQAAPAPAPAGKAIRMFVGTAVAIVAASYNDVCLTNTAYDMEANMRGDLEIRGRRVMTTKLTLRCEQPSQVDEPSGRCVCAHPNQVKEGRCVKDGCKKK